MKTQPILIIAALVWLLVACQQSTSSSPTGELPPSPEVDIKKEEYSVYSALFDYEYSNSNTEQVLIMDHTRVEKPSILEQDLADFQKNTPLSPDLVNSFQEVNQDSYLLEARFDIHLEYSILTQQEVDEFRTLDEASGWDLFYEKYPKTVGYIYLSRVGFNSDSTQALVAISVYRYDQPIKGNYYLFSKENGEWVVKGGMEWLT